MNETSKTRNVWSDTERSILFGHGIDIGCGDDPLSENVRTFDLKDGDANHITDYVREQFDFVFSSHCLEHMHDPKMAILEWWKLVKPGGHLFIIVPDEDLYEQGVFPSRFNPDHKATFTLCKQLSWSPRSFNVLDLAMSLPFSELVSLKLQDNKYNKTLWKFGNVKKPPKFLTFLFRFYYALLRRRFFFRLNFIERLHSTYLIVDQTMMPDVLAQIQLIVKKKSICLPEPST